MSEVVVVVEGADTSVTVTETSVVVDVTETSAVVEVGSSGPQGSSYALGEPIYSRVRNATGATLVKGTVVYTSGANGDNVHVSKALATSDATSARTMGFVADDILNGADGYVIISGYITGVDTEGATAGQIAYLSGTVAGAWTTTKPVAPIHLVYVGVVTRANKNNGSIFVHPQNGYELNEIHDVLISSPADNQVLTFESASGLWKNKTNTVDGVQSVVFGSPLTGGTVTSSGTVGLDQSLLSLTRSQVSDFASGTVAYASSAGSASTAGAASTAGTATYATTSGTAVGLSGTITRSQVTGTSALTLGSGLSGSSYDGSGAVTAAVDSTVIRTTGDQTKTGLTTLTPSATGSGAVLIKALASQSVDFFNIQTSTGTNRLWVSSDGAVNMNGMIARANNNSFIGNFLQTFQVGVNVNSVLGQLGVVATSASTIGAVIRGATSQSANLTEWQSDTASIVARVNSAGSIGTVGRLTSTPDGVPSTASRLFVNWSTATDIGAIIKGAASQSADLTQWQDSSGTVKAGISAYGGLGVNASPSLNSFLYVNAVNAVGMQIKIGSTTNDAVQYLNSSNTTIGGRNANAQIFTGSTAPLTTAVGGATTAASGTGTVATITTTSAHNLAVGDRVTVAGVTPTGYNGTFIVTAVTSTTVSYASATTGSQTVAGTVSVDAQASITARSNATTGLIVRAASGQQSNLTQWQDNTGSVLSYMNNTGNFMAATVVTTNSYVTLAEENSGGRLRLTKASSAVTNPGANIAKIYLRDGTTTGTLKLVVRAGAAGAETTILDNIPQ